MAITHKVYGEYDSVTNKYVTFDEPKTVITYEGRVLKVFKDNYRAMSDVYTVADWAEVIQDDGSILRVLVSANFECDQSGGHAKVDADAYYLSLHHCWKILQQAKREELDKQQALRREEEIRNSPARGKRMVVTGGRKVKVGTEGTVAFIHTNGGVLLKDDDKWQDRNAPGVWVDAKYLKAR